MQLSKQSEDLSQRSEVFAAFEEGEAVGLLTVRAGTHETLTVTVEWATLGTRAAVAEFVAAIDGLARERAATSLQIDTVDELVRYVARAEGYTGGLRAPLVHDETPGTGTSATAPQPFVEIDADELLRAVTRLLPECTVELRRHGVATLFGRRPKFVDLVASHPALRRSIALRVPNRGDAMPEAVASILDTAVSVLRRFPVEIHRISCEEASYDLATGQHAGETYPNVGMVYLNASYVLAGDLERMQGEWIARNPSRRLVPLVPAPFTRIDGIVAHELWHRIEDANHQANWIEIHRVIGAELGVDTLEHALRGGSEGAPDAWRQAYQRVVEEVSLYATTNPREAKAEMFMQWWCRSVDPTPLVACFGELIERVLLRGERA